MVAFVVSFIFVLIVLLALDGYSRHLGNPEPTDWMTILVVSALAGLVGAGLWGGLIEATRAVTGMLS